MSIRDERLLEIRSDKECRVETHQPPSVITAIDRRVGDITVRFNATWLDRAGWYRGIDLLRCILCNRSKPQLANVASSATEPNGCWNGGIACRCKRKF